MLLVAHSLQLALFITDRSSKGKRVIITHCIHGGAISSIISGP
jgi:hypothetical protein